MKNKHTKKKPEKEEKTYPAEEQGILPEETEEEIKEDMDTGEKEADVYSQEGRDDLEDDEEIDTIEQGFMEGASGGGQLGKDALTGESLIGTETVELKIKGKIYRFVNSENADKFKKKLEKE